MSPATSLMCRSPVATRLLHMITVDSLTKTYGKSPPRRRHFPPPLDEDRLPRQRSSSRRPCGSWSGDAPTSERSPSPSPVPRPCPPRNEVAAPGASSQHAGRTGGRSSHPPSHHGASKRGSRTCFPGQPHRVGSRTQGAHTRSHAQRSARDRLIGEPEVLISRSGQRADPPGIPGWPPC